MDKEYYLPINPANISQYFSRGIITPSVYIDGWIKDIQSKYESSILLCSKPLTSETDCSLTIAFADDEIKDIDDISQNFSLFNKPLPIARVKSLNFYDIAKSKTTAYNIEQGDAFLPKLISIIDKKETVNSIELDSAKKVNYFEDWNVKIDLFNRVLGGFSIMQIADLKNYDYPKNYFYNFSIINKKVKDKISDLSFDQDYSPYLNISSKKSSIYGKINSEFVSNYSKEKEGFHLPIKRGLIKLEEIDDKKNSYLLAVLATYGNDAGKQKKTSDFISALINDNFNSNIKEKLCLIFGINQGYSSFKNQYDIKGLKVKIKFKLDSEVDYNIIESIYQYVFYNKTDNADFSYIKEWCPKFKNAVDFQKYETYRIFDKDIIYKKKAIPGSPEYLQELFLRFSKSSVLAPIFSLFKENVLKNVQSITESIYEKIKSDIEQSEKQRKEANDIEQLLLKEQIKDLKEKNTKLLGQINKLPKADNLPYKVEEGQIDYGLKSEIDKTALVNKRKEILAKITSIGELKGIAKYYGVKSLSRFKNNDEDRESLSRIIIEKEEQLNNA